MIKVSVPYGVWAMHDYHIVFADEVRAWMAEEGVKATLHMADRSVQSDLWWVIRAAYDAHFESERDALIFKMRWC